MNAELPVAIRAVRPFRLVVDEDLAQLDGEVAMRDASTGTTLFAEGDPADGVVTVLEGSVEVLKQGRVLTTLGPGSVLGELSLFVPSAARTATVRASAPVRMVSWRAEDVAGGMAFVLAERLDRRTQDVVWLLKAAGTRLSVAELERFRGRAVQ